MAFTKIQPQQLQLPIFFSPSGDLTFVDYNTGFSVNLSRDLTGDFTIDGSLTLDGQVLSSTNTTNSSDILGKAIGGDLNTATGLNVVVNGNQVHADSGDFNTILNGKTSSFGQSGDYNTIVCGRNISFSDQITGSTVIADQASTSQDMTKNNSLLISFDSGVEFKTPSSGVLFSDDVVFDDNVYFNGTGHVLFQSDIKLDSSETAIFSGNCEFSGDCDFHSGHFDSGISVGGNGKFFIDSEGGVVARGDVNVYGEIDAPEATISTNNGVVLRYDDIQASSVLGYSVGGSVNQQTDINQGVTLNSPAGVITCVPSSSFTANLTNTFSLTNSYISSDDVVTVSLQEGGVGLSATVTATRNNSCDITITNPTASNVVASLVVNFAIIKVQSDIVVFDAFGRSENGTIDNSGGSNQALSRSLTRLTKPDGDFLFTDLDAFPVPKAIPANFQQNANIVQLVIGFGVESIGDNAFDGCGSLIGDLLIPATVSTIGVSAFEDCTSLEGKLIIEYGLSTIGDNAFKNCELLRGPLIIPNSVTSIGESAFMDCESFTSLLIGSRVTTIGESAFEGCTSLGEANIADGVTTVGTSAFEGCTSLVSATIPSSVTDFELGSTFHGCTSLTEIICHTTLTVLNSTNVLVGSSVTSIIVDAGQGWTAGANQTVAGKAGVTVSLSNDHGSSAASTKIITPTVTVDTFRKHRSYRRETMRRVEWIAESDKFYQVQWCSLRRGIGNWTSSEFKNQSAFKLQFLDGLLDGDDDYIEVLEARSTEEYSFTDDPLLGNTTYTAPVFFGDESMLSSNTAITSDGDEDLDFRHYRVIESDAPAQNAIFLYNEGRGYTRNRDTSNRTIIQPTVTNSTELRSFFDDTQHRVASLEWDALEDKIYQVQWSTEDLGWDLNDPVGGASTTWIESFNGLGIYEYRSSTIQFVADQNNFVFQDRSTHRDNGQNSNQNADDPTSSKYRHYRVLEYPKDAQIIHPTVIVDPEVIQLPKFGPVKHGFTLPYMGYGSIMGDFAMNVNGVDHGVVIVPSREGAENPNFPNRYRPGNSIVYIVFDTFEVTQAGNLNWYAPNNAIMDFLGIDVINGTHPPVAGFDENGNPYRGIRGTGQPFAG